MSILKELSTLSEAKNHMGEKEYSSFASWKSAVKKLHPNFWIDGDKDIAQAMVGENPFKKGKTKSVGEWDGAVGVIFNLEPAPTKQVSEGLDALMERMSMKTTTVGTMRPGDMEGLESDVHFIKINNDETEGLLDVLGVPRDGTPIRIRTGYMSYSEQYKLLFFSDKKYNMPGLVGKRPVKSGMKQPIDD